MNKENNINISADHLRLIKKKERLFRSKFILVAGLIIYLLAMIVTIAENAAIEPSLVILFIIIITAFVTYRNAEITYAFYGTVTEKEVRHAEIPARGGCPYRLYSSTEEGEFDTNFLSMKNYRNYFYCTVEVNGRLLEKLNCRSEDFNSIKIGSKVIVANFNINDMPVVYSISKK